MDGFCLCLQMLTTFVVITIGFEQKLCTDLVYLLSLMTDLNIQTTSAVTVKVLLDIHYAMNKETVRVLRISVWLQLKGRHLTRFQMKAS